MIYLSKLFFEASGTLPFLPLVDSSTKVSVTSVIDESNVGFESPLGSEYAYKKGLVLFDCFSLPSKSHIFFSKPSSRLTCNDLSCIKSEQISSELAIRQDFVSLSLLGVSLCSFLMLQSFVNHERLH